MDIYQDFTAWALAHGVELNGIALHRFPGRGLGIVADKRLEAGETILIAPISVLRTAQTVPKRISKRVGTISVNGLLAAELAIDTPAVRAPWRAVLPPKTDFEQSMPLLWHPALQALLPLASASLLQNQHKKILLDWTAVSAAFPTLSYDHYLYCWLLVSTRTFYYTSPKAKSNKPLSHDDCLALVPLADYFNHADVGCEVTYSSSGYKISTGQRVEKGDEVYISYGNHTNDFLLVEYGFVLAENKWDAIGLDEIFLPLFSERQKQELREAGFFGKFVLDRDGICYRTQVALRLLCMPVNKWQRVVANGVEDNDKVQVEVDRILLQALASYLDSVDEKLKQVKGLDYGLESQKQKLTSRWKQAQVLLTACISRMKGGKPNPEEISRERKMGI